MSVKTMAKRLLRLLGYELRRLPKHHVYGVDAYADQQVLLRGQTVRTIFDVGANVGQTAARYRVLFPTAKIYCFEPFEESFHSLCENFQGCALVQPQRLAVTSTTGVREFHCNHGPLTNSLLPSAAGWRNYIGQELMTTREVVSVPTMRLDDFCAQAQIDRIDLLKMDIQGAELMALQGAADLLERRAVQLIYTEVNFAPMYDGQPTFDDLVRYLSGYGYRLFGLYNVAHGEDAALAWCDAIFRSTAKGTKPWNV